VSRIFAVLQEVQFNLKYNDNDIQAHFTVVTFLWKPLSSVVEEPERGVRKHHLMLIRGLDTLLVHHTSARRSEVPHSTLPSPVHVIRKWEKRVTRTCNPIQLHCPLLFLQVTERCRHLLELPLPLGTLTALEYLPAHKEVDRVCFLCTLNAFFEWEREDAWVVS
jgi:hypothetical protein